MGKNKINKTGWANTPNVYYVGAMRTTDNRNGDVETENQQFIQMSTLFHQTFVPLDDAYQRSLASLSTKDVAEKDDERDVWGQVIEQVSKQWARMPDAAMAIHGRRVYQVITDIGFRTSEALVAENEKVLNIEQRFAEPELAADLAAMGLTEANQRFATLTSEIIALMSQRSEQEAARVKGELKAAREAMDAVYADFVELTNALIVTGAAPELEPLAALLNADYKKIEEQMAQSRTNPTVLVKSDIVGNHRYAVPEFAKWQTIVEANPKAFAVATNGTNRILSAMPKAAKVGGLYLALGGVAVKPTDAVDAKKEYALLPVSGGSDVTPVYPEGDEN